MQLLLSRVVAIFLLLPTALSNQVGDSLPNDDANDGKRLLELQATARRNLEAALRSPKSATGPNGTSQISKCSADKLVIRREWRKLSSDERMAYIRAVYCLTTKPSLFSEEQAPGSKSLFDSFAVMHISMARYVHNNFNFLAWHRYFGWAFEQSLKACGYQGAQPYWEWGYDAQDIYSSPLFDGSPDSLGSDGAPINRTATFEIWPPPPIHPTEHNTRVYPAGKGGGCMMSGPFSNLTVNLGPVAVGSTRYLNDIFRHNPQCLIRDLNPTIARRYLGFNSSVWTIEESEDIMGFQARATGDRNQGHGNYHLNGFGVHGAGHFAVGGENGANADIYSSPQDPIFFFHHSQLDRLWSIWQWLDMDSRQYPLFGTLMFENIPPSRNGTLDDILQMSPFAESRPMREMLSTIEGPYCYFYE